MKILRLFAFAGLMLAHASGFADDLQHIQELVNKALAAYIQKDPATATRYFAELLEKMKTSEAAQQDEQIQTIIGALGCGLPGYGKQGRAALNRILRTGKGLATDPNKRARTERFLEKCSTPDAPDPGAAADEAPSLALEGPGEGPAPGAGGTFKGGFASASPVAHVAVSKVEASDLQKRLLATEDPNSGLASTLARFGSGAQGTVTDHFIVVTTGVQSEAQGVAKCLDEYRVDLSKEFAMIFPPHLITVYNVQTEQRVYDLAAKLHGLNLSSGIIAYSVYADLSMVGVGSPELCGSLAHELTHLMIKRNFGDAPPWLEEGLASAVALSIPKHNQLSFGAGWRDSVLRSKWDSRPSVGELLNLGWGDFSSDKVGPGKAAAIQAMASVFIRYLAAQGKLQDLYFAVRKQDLAADLDNYRMPQQIVEETLGKNVAEIDKDFIKWFSKQRPTSPSSTREASNGEKPCKRSEPASPMAQQQTPCEPEVKNQAR